MKTVPGRRAPGRRLGLAACLAALAAPAAATRTADPPGRTTAPDLAALIACEREPADFLALAPVLRDPLRAVALGWRPLPQRNPFLTEYALTAPIRVFGHQIRHVAFSADNVVAVLDLPDPRALARQLELEAVIDTPQKAMFGRELRSTERTDPASGATRLESVILNVSNVDSHPGQTLAGCSYSVETAAETPAPADETEAAAPARPAPDRTAEAPIRP